jgi:O-antigen/teichoic acid export membrane protein
MTEDGARRVASLARGGVALGVAAVLSNALGYGFTVVLAHGFGPAEYGAVGALLGAGLIGAIPAGGLQYVLARRTAAGRLGAGRNEPAGLLLAAAVGLVLAVLMIAVSPVAAGFFHLESAWPMVWLGAMLLPYTISGALLGGLLGHERYVVFGTAQVLMAVGRFAAGVVAALAGFSVTGALGSLAVATAVTTALAYWLTGPRSWWQHGVQVRAGGLLGDLARSCSAIAGIAVLSNVDLLLARHYLPRDVSGAYALASLFAKVCLWGAQFVPTLVFARLARGGAEQRGLLLRATAVTAAVGGLAVIGTAVAAGPIIRTVSGAGSDYAGAVGLAVPFAVLGTMWALVQLALLAAVAAGDPRPGRLLWLMLAVEATTIALGPHGSPGAILTTCLVTTGALVAAGVLLDLRGLPAGRHARARGRRDPVSAIVD